MSTKLIGYQSLNDRRDIRKDVEEIRFIIHNKPYSVVDLSMGGFLLEGAVKEFRREEELLVTAVVASEGQRVKFGARAVVVRMDGDGRAGCHFLGLSPKAFDIVERLLMRRPLVRKAPKPKKQKKFFGLWSR